MAETKTVQKTPYMWHSPSKVKKEAVAQVFSSEFCKVVVAASED